MAAKTKKSSNNGAKPKPKAAIWPQIQSILNTINHTLIIMIAAFVTLLARSLSFQDTAMHMFLTVIGVSWKEMQQQHVKVVSMTSLVCFLFILQS